MSSILPCALSSCCGEGLVCLSSFPGLCGPDTPQSCELSTAYVVSGGELALKVIREPCPLTSLESSHPSIAVMLSKHVDTALPEAGFIGAVWWSQPLLAGQLQTLETAVSEAGELLTWTDGW